MCRDENGYYTKTDRTISGNCRATISLSLLPSRRIFARQRSTKDTVRLRMLRGALNRNGALPAQSERPELSHQTVAAVLSAALVSLPAEPPLKDVVLVPFARRLLESAVGEWQKRATLHQRRLEPRSKLFFYGVPGCGKSLTARGIAPRTRHSHLLGSLRCDHRRLPRPEAIHLASCFTLPNRPLAYSCWTNSTGAWKAAWQPTGRGELDRIVIALMQELEHSRPQGLIIGTSNLPKHLDDALWRRFDVALEFRAPAKAALSAFAKRVAATHQIPLKPDVLKKAINAKTFADGESVVVAEARRLALLEG